MTSTQAIIDRINKRLENIDKIVTSQDKELKELRRILKQLYEELYKKTFKEKECKKKASVKDDKARE